LLYFYLINKIRKLQEKLNNYFLSLDKWIQYYGFVSVEIPDTVHVNRIFKRSRVEASKFGKVDAYSFVNYISENATGDFLKTYSRQVFDFAMGHRSGAPIGFGAMLIVYPLLVVDNISGELHSAINSYCPKHFAAAEFPSVYDLNSGNLYFYQKNPVWGFAYYGTYRRETYNFYSPQSWSNVSANTS
jgi:hypothetical protein